MDTERALTARIAEGFRPEDNFSGVTLTKAPSAWPEDKICYQWLTFNLNTGVIIFGDTGMIQREWEHAAARVPGYLQQAINDYTVPPNGAMTRLIPNSGYDSETYPQPNYQLFDAQTLYDLALRVLPMAQRIMETMHRVGPKRELEWSAAAAQAWHDLVDATDYTLSGGTVTWKPAKLSPVPDYYHEVSAFIERHPELVDSSWLHASDAELDEYAAYKPGSGYGGVAGRMCSSGNREIYDDGWGGGNFFGDRAALYAYRDSSVGAHDLREAGDWLESDPPGRITRDIVIGEIPMSRRSDVELEQMVEQLHARGLAQGVFLAGIPAYLKSRRAAARQSVEQRLALLGAQCNSLERDLTIARRHRAAELAEVLSWDDGRSDHFLGKLAGMSHTAVRNLRDRLAADPDSDSDSDTDAEDATGPEAVR